MTGRPVALFQLVLLLSICNVALAQSTGTFIPTGNMNVARSGHTATLLTNGKVLIAGGSSLSTALSSAELYDPATGTFTPTGDMTWAQSGHTATLLPDGKVLIIGGSGQAGSTVTADLYDPNSGTFRPIGLIHSAAADCPSAALLNNGKVLIAFGTYYPGPKGRGSPALLYDPIEQQFTAAAVSTIDIVDEEACPTATLLADGNVLVTWQNPDAELYQPENNSFDPAGRMIVPGEYWGYTAILLATGNVLIAGGDDGWASTTAELFDPSVPTFKPTGYLKHARGRPTATLLPDGKVLVTGGYVAHPVTPSALNTAAEIYDPADGTFSSDNEMVALRTGHTATLLMDGRVLLAGGHTAASYPFSPDSSAELYVPAVLSPAQIVTSIQFDRTSVIPGTSYSVNVSGSNLAPQTFFDVRFSAPGTKEFAVVLNWQIGVTASHEVPTGTASGTWTINGVRAHQIETDHTGNFVPVSATIAVSP